MEETNTIWNEEWKNTNTIWNEEWKKPILSGMKQMQKQTTENDGQSEQRGLSK